ncbi:MAG: YdbL family protein [Pseudomonadota bacterium]
MKKHRLFIVLIILFGFIFSATAGFGEDIKERMKNRLPEIVDLKARGIIGENNQGFLQFVGQTKEKEALVAEENKDRESVYAAIANSQGTSADMVGRRRAIQIVSVASPGDWLQNEAGNWYQK